MKAQEQYMREILDGQRYTVDPRHEAAFREMLLGKKRRRRFTAIFFILAGLAVASVVLLTQINPGENHVATQPADVQSPGAYQKTPAGTDKQDSETSDYELESGASNTVNPQQISESAETEASEPQAMLTVSAGRNNSSTSPGRSATQNRISAGTNENPSGSASNRRDQGPSAASANSKEVGAVRSQDKGLSEVSEPQEQQVGETEVTRTEDSHSNAEEVHTEATAILSSSEDGQKSETEIIIPAGKQLPDKRIAFGLSGTWYPAGLGMNGSEIAVGHGIQLGGYVTYRMTPRLALRTDAGFGVLDGGFQFMKESETEVYGFSVLTIHDRMNVDRLYSGYLASEIGWIAGKHTITAGLHGQVFYGAKGDIRREEIATDAPGPKEIVSENVWVSISDMQRLSLHGALGLRSKVAPRIELAAAVRIPLLKPVQLTPGAKAFEYTIRSPGISPMLSVSYQISQQ